LPRCLEQYSYYFLYKQLKTGWTNRGTIKNVPLEILGPVPAYFASDQAADFLPVTRYLLLSEEGVDKKGDTIKTNPGACYFFFFVITKAW
jgi:hypothetical protein